MRIERRSQASEQIGQRILEVAILALAESVPSHVDVTTEEVFLRIQRGDLPALVAGKQLIDHRATEPVQIGTYPVPIMLFQSDFSGLHCSGVRADDAVLFHAMTPSFQWFEARSPCVARNPILARLSRVEGTFRQSAAACPCRGGRPRPSRAAARFRRLAIVPFARDPLRLGWRCSAAPTPWREFPPRPSRRLATCGVSRGVPRLQLGQPYLDLLSSSPPGDGLSISPKRSPSGAPSDSYLQTQRAPRHIGSSPVVGSDADRPLGWARKRSDSCFQIFEVKRTSLIRRQEPRFKATRSHLPLRKAQFDRGEA